MKTLTAIGLRKTLGAVLDEVSKKGEDVMISRANKPMAVIISVEEYEEKVLKKNRAKRLNEIAAMMDKWKKRHLSAKVNIVKALRETREGR